MQIKIVLTALALSFGLISACSQQSAPYQNINTAEFKEKMNQPDVVILDVRTPQETAQGKIQGAIEMDFNSPAFESKVQALDKNKTYLVYCAVGGRSASACNTMAAKGFKQLYNLKGGYNAWKSQ